MHRLPHFLRIFILSLAIALLAVPALWAQRISDPTSIERSRLLIEQKLAEALENEQMTEAEYILAMNRIEALYISPLDINTVQQDILSGIPLLTPYQTYQFIHHRLNRGRFRSLYDLKMIEGWDEETLAWALPLFLCKDEATTALGKQVKTGILQGRTHLAINSSYQQGTRSEGYLGPPLGASLRFQYQSKAGLSMALGVEQDRHEPWSYDGRKGFDAYLGHVALSNTGVVKRLVLGDYRVGWGEGLVIAQGYQPRRLSLGGGQTRGIRPMMGLSEGGRMRGLATDVDLGRLRLALFASHRRMDGNINEDGEITALSDAGLHRTERELRYRHRVAMQTVGAQLIYQTPRLELSLQGIGYGWAGDFLRSATGASHIALLDSMQRHTALSLSYRYVSKQGRLLLSGEIARSSLGSYAIAQSIGYKSAYWGELRLVARLIPDLYWSYYGQTYSHYSRPNDEIGLGVHYERRDLLPDLSLTLSVDLYRPYLEQDGKGHRRGARILNEWTYRTSRTSALTARLSWYQQEGSTNTLRLALQHRAELGAWHLQSKLSASRIDTEWGWAGQIRISYKPNKGKFSADASAIYHSVDQWAGRFSYFEPRLSYEYGSLLLYQKGYRLSAVGNYKLSNRIRLGAKLSYAHNDRQEQSIVSLLLFYR